jgi:hypothetical protein
MTTHYTEKYTKPKYKKFEYKSVPPDDDYWHTFDEEELNKLGLEGWELVGFDNSIEGGEAWFKREVKHAIQEYEEQ